MRTSSTKLDPIGSPTKLDPIRSPTKLDPIGSDNIQARINQKQANYRPYRVRGNELEMSIEYGAMNYKCLSGK